MHSNMYSKRFIATFMFSLFMCLGGSSLFGFKICDLPSGCSQDMLKDKAANGLVEESRKNLPWLEWFKTFKPDFKEEKIRELDGKNIELGLFSSDILRGVCFATDIGANYWLHKSFKKDYVSHIASLLSKNKERILKKLKEFESFNDLHIDSSYEEKKIRTYIKEKHDLIGSKRFIPDFKNLKKYMAPFLVKVVANMAPDLASENFLEDEFRVVSVSTAGALDTQIELYDLFIVVMMIYTGIKYEGFLNLLRRGLVGNLRYIPVAAVWAATKLFCDNKVTSLLSHSMFWFVGNIWFVELYNNYCKGLWAEHVVKNHSELIEILESSSDEDSGNERLIDFVSRSFDGEPIVRHLY